MTQQRKITYNTFPRQHGPDSHSDSEKRNITCSSFRTPRGSIKEKFIKIQCSQKKKKGPKVLD